VFDSLISSAAPLIFASTGALLSELGGSLAIFIEGFINLGSFLVFLLTDYMNSAFFATVFVCLTCGTLGWLVAYSVRVLKADGFITALAFNVFSEGLTSFLSQLLYRSKGTLRSAAVAPLASLDIPLVHKLPLVGGVIFPLSVFALWALFFALLLSIALDKTRQGLYFRASGLDADAARERGLRPAVYREVSWALAAALAGLAGAALTFRIGVYAPGNSGGRGWIALALDYLGGKRVWGVVLAALVFTAAERLAFGAQGAHVASATALLGLPPLLALLFYALSRLRSL
jgi:simple sugar transport system permease protein